MKQNKLITAIAAIALSLVFNNCIAQKTSKPGLSAIKKTIEKTNAIYFDLFSKKDVSITSLYTEDACLLTPHAAAVCGKAALKKDFEEAFADGKVTGVKFQTKAIYGDGGEYITEEGTWQVFKQGGGLLDDGKYLKLWKKTRAGWKIFRDVFNSNHQAPR